MNRINISKKGIKNFKKTITNLLLLFFLPMMIPVFFIVDLIRRYGVNFPYSDEWIIVPTFQNIDAGRLTFNDLWQLGSYHRLFFTKLVIVISAYLTDWNIKTEIYISFGFCLITAFFIYLIVRRSIKNWWLALLTMLIAMFWLFSPVQSENWLWGWDVAWFMCTAGAVASIYFVSRANEKNNHSYLFLITAIITGIVSTFSFGWGQAIWPVGLLILLAQKQKRFPIIIWTISAVLVYGAYYYNFKTYSGTPSVFAFAHNPITAISYFFILFGRPFTESIYPAMLLGAISLFLLIPVLYLAWEQRRRLNTFLPWLGLMLFSLIGAFMIILGRLNIISDPAKVFLEATQPRYTAMALLYLIGLSGLIITLTDGLKFSNKILKYIVLLILVVQIPLIYSSYYNGQATSLDRYRLMVKLQVCSKQPPEEITIDCLASNNYLNNDIIRKEQLQYLKNKHWAGY